MTESPINNIFAFCIAMSAFEFNDGNRPSTSTANGCFSIKKFPDFMVFENKNPPCQFIVQTLSEVVINFSG